MKMLELNKIENIDGVRFWGTGTVTDCALFNAGLSDYCLVCNQDYMFWFKVGDEYNCQWVEQARPH